MKRLFKYFIPRYWKLRRILSDIKEVRELILSNRYTYLCLAFAAVNDRYWRGLDVAKYIPEFNPIFLTGKDADYGRQPMATMDTVIVTSQREDCNGHKTNDSTDSPCVEG